MEQKKSNSQTCAGLFLCEKKNQSKLNTTVRVAETPADLKNSLFIKVKMCFESYNSVDPSQVKQFNQNMIELSIINEGIIRAFVHCIFCRETKKQKKIIVFHQSSQNSNYWIISNFKKHLDKDHLKKQNNDTSTNIQKKSGEIVVSDIITTNCKKRKKFKTSIADFKEHETVQIMEIRKPR